MRNFDDVIFYEQIFQSDICNKIEQIAKSGKNWEIQISDENSQNKFWMMKVNNDRFFTNDCFNIIKNIIGDNFTIHDIYFNAQAAFQDGAPHIDSDSEEYYTFLYYVNREWDIKWGGHTSFLNGYFDAKFSRIITFDDEPRRVREISFMPVPNCALFFPSNIVHFARGPSKEIKDLRFTLAYKLKKRKMIENFDS